MRKTSLSLAAMLAAMPVVAQPQTRPAPRRWSRSPFSRAYHRVRSFVRDPARADRSEFGLARLAAAEAKRERRLARNRRIALHGGIGVV